MGLSFKEVGCPSAVYKNVAYYRVLEYLIRNAGARECTEFHAKSIKNTL